MRHASENTDGRLAERTFRLGGVLLAGLLLLWGASAIRGGEEDAGPPLDDLGGEGEEVQPGGEEDAWWEKDPEQWTLAQTRSYQRFAYLPGGRSPFKFRRQEEAEARRPRESDALPDDQQPRGEAPPPDDQRKFFLTQILRIELLIVAHDYKSALAACTEVRDIVLNQWGGPPSHPDNYRLFQKVLSYEKTSKRLQQAKETREEFESLPINIKGIRWTPQGSSALINDEIYEAGSAIQNIRAAAPVQIEMIEEDAVLFLYKGQRFRKTLGFGNENQNR